MDINVRAIFHAASSRLSLATHSRKDENGQEAIIKPHASIEAQKPLPLATATLGENGFRDFRFSSAVARALACSVISALV